MVSFSSGASTYLGVIDDSRKQKARSVAGRKVAKVEVVSGRKEVADLAPL